MRASVDGEQTLIRLIDVLGTADFPIEALRSLESAVLVPYVTAYRKRKDGPVEMRFAGTWRRPDVTARCWEIYRDGPQRNDRTFASPAEPARRGEICWRHLTADQIDDPRHRIDVYRKHDLIDRLSLIQSDSEDGFFALNFYRTSDQGHFRDRDFAALERVAPVLLALSRRHAALLPDGAFASSGERIAGIAKRLADHPARLSEREREVCARLAIGMTYDGIAADLGIAVTSAKTYRNRAFARLEIHVRAQLTPICFGR